MRHVFVKRVCCTTHWFKASDGDSLIPPHEIEHARLSGKGARLKSHHQGVKQITVKPIWPHELQTQATHYVIGNCQSQHPLISVGE